MLMSSWSMNAITVPNIEVVLPQSHSNVTHTIPRFRWDHQEGKGQWKILIPVFSLFLFYIYAFLLFFNSLLYLTCSIPIDPSHICI